MIFSVRETKMLKASAALALLPSVLKSGADFQSAHQAGNVTITKTNIMVNCPVIYTPLGGLLPGVTVTSSEN